MSRKQKILITVKTYPVLSEKYAELVCTAGVTEAGEWRRLYPVRFRQLYTDQKYQKYQWVEATLEQSNTDNRPESYKILKDSLKTIGKPLLTKNNWLARRENFSNKVKIYDDLADLIGRAHRNELSLAAFKPKRYLKFTHELVKRDWDAEKLARLEVQRRQLHLFKDEETVARQFSVVKKLPYKFSYHFEDCHGKTSRMMIEDWEIGALYWNCLKMCNGDEKSAIEKVREKYWDQFIQSGKYDLTLLFGTTLAYHRKKAPNPFVIIGVFYPPVDNQMTLL